MSSIRLFILSAFDEFGPMHGHLLRSIAEKMKVPLWTDISVGAVYGAMKRMAAEGLLEEQGRERAGNRPTRQIYEITEDGRHALAGLRREGLSEVWFKPDPFDLALTQMDAKTARKFPSLVAERLKTVQAMLAENRRAYDGLPPQIGLAKQWALKHTRYRLESEIAYLTDLLKVVNDIVSDRRSHK